MFKKVLNTDPYLDKLAELKPDLYSELLLEFIKRQHTKEAIILHETTPMDILRSIIKEESPKKLKTILQHPNCPPELIEQKISEGSVFDLIEIAKNCSLSEKIIRELAKGSKSVLIWICRRPDCPPDILASAFLNFKNESEKVSSDISYFSEVDTNLLLAIASHRNTPQQVFEKILKMNLNLKNENEEVLGVVLLENPSVSDEDKVFSSLTGFVKSDKHSIREYYSIEFNGLPTSLVFRSSKFPIHLKQALADVGQPMALLDLEIELNSKDYDFNAIVEDWIKQETIYRTLWPELSERKDVSFAYRNSSYDGDNFYFKCEGVELEHDFTRGARAYNSMTYPFIDRPWVEILETMDIDISHENFDFHDVAEMFDNASHEENYDLVLATIISQNYWSHRVSKPQYTLSKKGEEFVCEWAQNFFEDDKVVNVIIHPDEALPYSWKAIPNERKEIITSVIVNGFNTKVDTKYQYAEHFLVCIALNPYTPESIKNSLKEVDSKVVSQALEVS